MNDYMSFIFPVMIITIVALSLGELLISALWLPAYFRYRLPLFRKEYPLTTMPDVAAIIPELEQKLKRSLGRPAIVFRALNANEIAFRNNFGSRNAMSGLIRLQPDQGRMCISGHLYWSFFLLPLIFLLVLFSFPVPAFFFVFLAGGFMIGSAIQRVQYGKIAQVIVETAVSTDPSAWQSPKPVEQTYQPQITKFDATPYDPVLYDPQNNKPQTGISNVELILLLVLVVLIISAGVVAFLFFSG